MFVPVPLKATSRLERMQLAIGGKSQGMLECVPCKAQGDRAALGWMMVRLALQHYRVYEILLRTPTLFKTTTTTTSTLISIPSRPSSLLLKPECFTHRVTAAYQP